MTVLKKIKTLLKEKGIIKTTLHIYEYFKNNSLKYSFDTYNVFEICLHKTIPVIEPAIDVELFKIKNDKQDIEDLISFWPDYFKFMRTDEEIRKDINYYFDCGDECFCVKLENKIVGMTWIGYQQNYMLNSLAKKIGLNEDEVILHRGFVSSEARGKNIYTFLLSSLQNYAKDKGYKKCFAYVGAPNIASLRVHAKVFSEYILLHHLRVVVFGIPVDLFPEYHRKSKIIYYLN